MSDLLIGTQEGRLQVLPKSCRSGFSVASHFPEHRGWEISSYSSLPGLQGMGEVLHCQPLGIWSWRSICQLLEWRTQLWDHR